MEIEPKNLEPNFIPLTENILDSNMDISGKTIIKTFQIERLFPVKTGAAGEATEELVDYNPTWKMDDAATKDVYFFYIIPIDLIISQIDIIWISPASSGNMYWQMDISAGAKGEETALRTTGGTAVATATIGGDKFNYTTVDNRSGVNFVTLKKNDIVGIRFRRLGAHASDTLSDQVNIYGLKITYN